MTALATMLGKTFRAALLLPAAYWLYLIFSGSLGADPAKDLNHRSGEIALYYLVLNLLVGVLVSQSFRWPSSMRFLLGARRFLGVVTFVYLMAHVFFYLAMESFSVSGFTQIYTKLYLIFGASAWLLLSVLAITSNNFAVQMLGGRRWKQIHRLVYLAASLAMVHVMLIEKTDLWKFGAVFAALWVAEGTRVIRAWRLRCRSP